MTGPFPPFVGGTEGADVTEGSMGLVGFFDELPPLEVPSEGVVFTESYYNFLVTFSCKFACYYHLQQCTSL